MTRIFFQEEKPRPDFNLITYNINITQYHPADSLPLWYLHDRPGEAALAGIWQFNGGLQAIEEEDADHKPYVFAFFDDVTISLITETQQAFIKIG